MKRLSRYTWLPDEATDPDVGRYGISPYPGPQDTIKMGTHQSKMDTSATMG